MLCGSSMLIALGVYSINNIERNFTVLNQKASQFELTILKNSVDAKTTACFKQLRSLMVEQLVRIMMTITVYRDVRNMCF